MKAKDLMTAKPKTCSLDTNLAAAAELMLAGDCGLLPVLEESKLVGVVTDRDLYIALATRDRQASDVRIGEVAQSPVYTCSPDASARRGVWRHRSWRHFSRRHGAGRRPCACRRRFRGARHDAGIAQPPSRGSADCGRLMGMA